MEGIVVASLLAVIFIMEVISAVRSHYKDRRDSQLTSELEAKYQIAESARREAYTEVCSLKNELLLVTNNRDELANSLAVALERIDQLELKSAKKPKKNKRSNRK